jgi:hypothetical protein
MTKKEKIINEGVSNFISAFFDGVKKNTANRFLAQAKKKGLPKDAIKIMNTINKDRERLDSILKKYSK